MAPAALIALGFVLRLAWVLVVPSKPVGDFAMYLESATHLLEHGQLDPQFLYMPGYVGLVALVQALGGGLLAVKMIGVLAGTGCVAAVWGIADAVGGRRTALIATAAAALWPAGVMLASVTGTDMPAAALLGLAVMVLVRWAERRPLRSAVAFGALMGLGAWVRAVAAPLAAFGFFYWLALGTGWRVALRRAGISVAVALLVLLPWAARNRARYGEIIFTDVHGGHTALVGANPNSEGCYSRSLNYLFSHVTPYRMFDEPHVEADHAAGRLAMEWTRFEPLYALGLVGSKADRLIGHERGLLYWPVFRQGVLREPQASWFAARRQFLDETFDLYWNVLLVLASTGIALAVAQRRWKLLALLPIPLALAGMYSVIFAEWRYRLPIALFVFVFAAEAVAWAWGVVRKRTWRRTEALGAAAGLLFALVVWPLLVAGCDRLREGHRWAVTICTIGGQERDCRWRRIEPSRGPSPVRGAWDAVALRTAGGEAAVAETEIELPPGQYRLRAAIETHATGRPMAPASAAGPRPDPLPVRFELVAGEKSLGALALPVEVAPRPFEARFSHDGGRLRLFARVAASPLEGARGVGTTLWVGNLVVEPGR